MSIKSLIFVDEHKIKLNYVYAVLHFLLEVMVLCMEEGRSI